MCLTHLAFLVLQQIFNEIFYSDSCFVLCCIFLIYYHIIQFSNINVAQL